MYDYKNNENNYIVVHEIDRKITMSLDNYIYLKIVRNLCNYNLKYNNNSRILIL